MYFFLYTMQLFLMLLLVRTGRKVLFDFHCVNIRILIHLYSLIFETVTPELTYAAAGSHEFARLKPSK